MRLRAALKQGGSTASRASDASKPLLWLSDLLGWSANHRGHLLVVKLLRQLCSTDVNIDGPPVLARRLC